MDSGLAEVLARRRQQTEDSQNAGVSMIEPGSGGSSFSPPRKKSSEMGAEAPSSGPTSTSSNPEGAAAATGAGMAALALGNENLRKASEESSVGTGGLFARPTPAQLLRGASGVKASPNPKAPVKTMSDNSAEPIRADAAAAPASAPAHSAPGLGAYATINKTDAGKDDEQPPLVPARTVPKQKNRDKMSMETEQSGSHAASANAPMPGLGAYAGAKSEEAADAQKDVAKADSAQSSPAPNKPEPEYSSLGTGGLFSRPTPAMLLRGKGAKVAQKKQSQEKTIEAPAKEQSSASDHPPMPGLGAYADDGGDEPAIIQMPKKPNAATPAAPAPAPDPPMPPLIAEAIQIGKLNTVLEDEEEDVPYSQPPSQPSSGILPVPQAPRSRSGSHAKTVDAAAPEDSMVTEPDIGSNLAPSARAAYDWRIKSIYDHAPRVSSTPSAASVPDSGSEDSDSPIDDESAASSEGEADPKDVGLHVADEDSERAQSAEGARPPDKAWWERDPASGQFFTHKSKPKPRKPGALPSLPVMDDPQLDTDALQGARDDDDDDDDGAPATLSELEEERKQFYQEREAALASLSGKIARTSELPGQLEAALTKGLVQPLAPGPEEADEKEGASAQSQRQRPSSSPEKKISWTQYARDRAKHIAQLVDEADGVGEEFIHLQEVLLWLRNAGWGQYEETFAVNQIDFDEMFTLEEGDLRDMGLKLANNRRNLLSQIATLKSMWMSEINGQKEMEGKSSKAVFVKGKKDQREEENASLIADEAEYEQKRGYVTWSDHTAKRWKRRFVVLQGAMLHVFKSSDHVTLKPAASRTLHGTLIAQSEVADHCIHIQADPAGPSRADFFLVAQGAAECQEWLQQLVAAANLQVFKHVFGQARPPAARNPTLLLMVEEVTINHASPFLNPTLVSFVTDQKCNPIVHFDAVPMGNGRQDPNDKGVVRLEPKGKILLHRKLRSTLGPDALVFFEFRHTVKDSDGQEQEQVQYWSYTNVDALKSGEVTLDWLKKPTVLDPNLLGKVPKKEKSSLVLHVRSSEGGEVKDKEKGKDKTLKRAGSARHSGLEQAISYLVSLLQSAIPDPEQLARVSAFLGSLRSIASPAAASTPIEELEAAIAALAAGSDAASSASAKGMGSGGGRSGGTAEESEVRGELGAMRARCEALEGEVAALRAALSAGAGPAGTHAAGSGLQRRAAAAVTPPLPPDYEAAGRAPQSGEWEFTGPEDHSLYSSSASRTLPATVDPADGTPRGGETHRSGASAGEGSRHEEAASRGGSGGVWGDVEGWLGRHELEGHGELLRMNGIGSLAQAAALSLEEVQQLGMGKSLAERRRVQKALAELQGGVGGGATAAEHGERKLPPKTKAAGPKSSGGAGRPEVPEPVWGECYGELGEAAKGQKCSWVEVRMHGRRWEKVYAKRARNTLLLFPSAVDLHAPSARICLDGFVVARSAAEEGRPFAVAAHKSLFQRSREDFALAAPSDKEAASWEKALMKGVVWHAEQKSKSAAHAAKAPPPPATVGSPSVPMVPSPPPSSSTPALPPAPAPPASAPAGGIASSLLSGVGHTFTFSKKKPKPPPSSQHAAASSQDSEAALGARTPSGGSGFAAGGTAGRDGGEVTVELVRLGVQRKAGESYNNPVVVVAARGTTGGKHVGGEDASEVAVRGGPSDSEHELSIGATRTVSLAAVQDAAEQSIYFEFRHQKPNKVSTKAWAFLPLQGLGLGERELVMYEKPVVLGPRAGRAAPLKGFSLSVRILSSPGIV